MCHHPRFYKYLHKQHHEYKISNVGATAWNNPEESLGIMVIAWSSVLLVGGFDLFTWCVWLWWVNLMDHWVHAGYDFPYDVGVFSGSLGWRFDGWIEIDSAIYLLDETLAADQNHARPLLPW